MLTCIAMLVDDLRLLVLLKRLRERLKQLPNRKRPGRSCARAVKSRPFRYTVRVLKRDLD
ncbi:hypothetical protein BURKHO8Y_190040 [Burkholderia sp. 8Y]|nr:hypothetical protein BURKHO8Y_190040 [Burkholderia sp. 8Y]